MPFKSISEIKRTVGYKPRGISSLGGELTIGVHRKLKGHMLVIVIRKPLLMRARFMAGDTIDVLFDSSDNLGWIKRDNNATLRITHLCKGSKDYRINTTMLPGMPFVHPTQAVESVDVTNEGIIFTLPKNTQLYKSGMDF